MLTSTQLLSSKSGQTVRLHFDLLVCPEKLKGHSTILQNQYMMWLHLLARGVLNHLLGLFYGVDNHLYVCKLDTLDYL